MPAVNAFIVEDSPIILESLVATLEELAPVKVVGTAGDESSAVSWLQSRPEDCDLVIIDIFLKSGSGLGVLRKAAQSGVRGRRGRLRPGLRVAARVRCASCRVCQDAVLGIRGHGGRPGRRG